MSLRRRDQEHEPGGVIVFAGDPLEYTGGAPSERSPFDPCYHRKPDATHRVVPVAQVNGEAADFARDKVNFKEIPIDRKDFDDDSHGFADFDALLDGLGERGSLFGDGMIEKWGIEGLEPGGFDLEGFIDEWGPGSGGLFDDETDGYRGLLGDDRGGLTSGTELVSDYYDQGSPTPIEGGTKGDPLTGNPWSEGSGSFGVKITGGHDKMDGKWVESTRPGAAVSGEFGGYGAATVPKGGPEPGPEQRQPGNADRGTQPAPVRLVMPVRDKDKSAVEKGVDSPKTPKPGTGVARPDPTRDPVGGMPPAWDRVAWERLRAFTPPKKGSDEGGWGGSEAGGDSRESVRGVKVDWELVIGGGHTDPGRDAETRTYGPRRPKRVGVVKVRKPTSDDPSVFGPSASSKSVSPKERG